MDVVIVLMIHACTKSVVVNRRPVMRTALVPKNFIEFGMLPEHVIKVKKVERINETKIKPKEQEVKRKKT
jgi:hypothetical protein